MSTTRAAVVIGLALLSSHGASGQSAPTVDPRFLGSLAWRSIGPFRAGRVSAVAGDPTDQNAYYAGMAGGGVWKTNDAGQTWKCVTDAARLSAIGAVAVSESSPRVVFAGAGEGGWAGDGVWKSVDAGTTWTNVGLRDTHIISAIFVDPKNPDLVLVAATGNATSGQERGVFKSTDGGRSWTKTLAREGVGSSSLAVDPATPNIVYAPISNPVGGRSSGPAPVAEAGPNLFRSTDEGSTWTPVGGKDLPRISIGKIGVAVAGRMRGTRLFAIFRDGLYRSDDSGDSWTRANTDPRIVAGGVVTDPGNPDVLYVTQTSMYRSTDGGRTFESFAGAPSGDDFRLLWVDPHNSKRLFAGVDQGAIVSVNGGETWSSWYNQATGQLYHVSTDTAVPYRVYAAQQDSGTVAVPSRSDFGEISFRDWYSTGGFEFGYIVADPLDPNIVFAGGWYGAIVRFDRRTNQIVHVFARGSKYRGAGNAPMWFSPQDPHALYLGQQVLLKTTDAGMSWTAVSGDLTVPAAGAAGAGRGAAPSTGSGQGRGGGGGVINTFSLSHVKAGEIWVGTSNGLVQLTDDGGAHWREVTPPDLGGAAVDIIEAGHADADTAYFCGNQSGKPAIFRTHDRGRTWQRISAGVPDDAIVRVIREDPVRKGLLFAGTESSIWASFDDGDHWQSLQLNLPTTSMRDVEIHGDDLVVATYGRGLWILDDITPLRQIAPEIAASNAHLFKPASTIRFHWDVNEDTPLPIEVPTSPNPPEGAIVDYYLKSAPTNEVTLTITDAQGGLVRRYSSTAPPPPTLKANVPSYWFAPSEALPTAAGMNRFAWNLRYETPKILPFSYYGNILTYIEYTLAEHAIPGRTPATQPEGAIAVPGTYTVMLTVGGQSYKQPLTVAPDPRVRATQADLLAQLDFAKRMAAWMATSYDLYYEATSMRAAIADQHKALANNPDRANVVAMLATLDRDIPALENNAPGSFGIVNRDLARLFAMLTSGDGAPAAAIKDAALESCQGLAKSVDAWTKIESRALAVDSALGGQPLPTHLAHLPASAKPLTCGTPALHPGQQGSSLH
jgi:photosystem II stability/assembly factor-like uncharacterized protein